MKIVKKKKELTHRPNLRRSTSTHRLCGSNSFYGLKLSTFPTKKCGLCILTQQVGPILPTLIEMMEVSTK